MTCKHNWLFIDGLTKRIRCTRCAAMQFVYKQDEYDMSKFMMQDMKFQVPENNIVFYNGGGATAENEVMRIDRNGVKVNKKLSTDEATDAVIRALDGYIKTLAQKEYERGFEDGKTRP